MILSHGLWAHRFGSDRSVIGRVVHLNREDYTVVGVMGEKFRLLGFTPQLWTPLAFTAADQAPAARKNRFLYIFARLVPGITLEQANSELRRFAQRAATEYPTLEKRWGAAARSLPDYVVYAFGIRKALAIIMTTVGFILLIACANVAGLLLTRAVGRQKELAIRVSLGAGRSRIIRQLLTEGAVIACVGGGVGLLLTYFGISLVRANLTFNAAISAVPITCDRNVLLFAVGISCFSAALSSLIPALNIARADVNVDLKSESRAASSGLPQSRLRGALVSGEIALALLLLIGTCLLIRGVYLLDHQKLGFRTDHTLTASIALDHARYGEASQQLVFTRRLLSGLQQIPGVQGVAVASDLPGTGPDSVAIRIKGRPDLVPDEHPSAFHAVVTTNYFRVAGIPLLRGRSFTDMDNSSLTRVVLVNQEFVRHYFRDEDALGKQIELDVKGSAPAWSEIVGVVSNVKGFSENTRIDPEVYETFLQRPVSSFALMLRCNCDPAGLTPDLYRAVAQLDSDLPLANVMSMDAVIERQRNGNPFFERILGTFALLALVLAAIGLYGVVAYSVGQRAHEIGIRMALGAKRSDVMRMILRGGFKLALIGSAVGLVIALPLPKVFDAMFPDLHSGAPVIYLIVLAAILIVTVVATFIPARRATHVDPVSVLHSQ
jgi:putative ABC transport system permease protein